jgi:hypothetical protein
MRHFQFQSHHSHAPMVKDPTSSILPSFGLKPVKRNRPAQPATFGAFNHEPPAMKYGDGKLR